MNDTQRSQPLNQPYWLPLVMNSSSLGQEYPTLNQAVSSCRAPNLTLAALELCLVQLRSPSGRSSDVSLDPAEILRSTTTKVPASASRHAQISRGLTHTGGRRCWEMQRCLQSSRPRCPARLLRPHRKEAVFTPIGLQERYELGLAWRRSVFIPIQPPRHRGTEIRGEGQREVFQTETLTVLF